MVGLDLKPAKKFWGRGYATNTLLVLTQYLFTQGSNVLVISPNLQNKTALKLYGRLDFEPNYHLG